MRIIIRLLALCFTLIASTSLLTFTGDAQELPYPNLSPPPVPVIINCELKRSPSGVYTLHLIGHNISEETNVIVGQVSPKKVKFKGAVDDQSGLMKLVLKGRLCESLPGNVVVTNPDGRSGPPFGCNQRCRG